MKKLRAVVARIAGLSKSRRNDRELDDEIESHLQMHTEENLQLGMTPQEARRAAIIKLGGIEATKEAYRDQRGLPWIETLWQDIRFGARMLRKNLSFTAVVTLTLALGIGANTALFTALDAVMFRPLRVPEANRLVLFANRNDEDFSFPFYDRLRKGVNSFSGCAASQFRAPPREVSSAGNEAEPVAAQAVSGNFFSVMGTAASLGRTLVEDDDRTGAAQAVVVISHAYWQRQFGMDPGIVGKVIRLDNLPTTIVGVMPAGFIGFETDVSPDLWFPIQLTPQIESGRDGNILGEGVSWLVLFARLRENVSREQAHAEVDVFFRRELEERIANNPNISSAERERTLSQKLELVPGRAGYVGARSKFSQPLKILMAAVGVLLLIACANVAGLLLARGTVRQREFAVRAALGAGRKRIVRQLFTESIMLALMAGVLGLIFARWGTEFLAGFLAKSRDAVPIKIDMRALVFTMVICMTAAAVFGLTPSWRISRLDLATSIKNQSGGASSSRTTLQRLLVVAQVTLSVLLLAGAGLFARTLLNLRAIDFGFRTENIVALSVDPGKQKDGAKIELLIRRVLAELETLPGLHSVSLGGAGMLTGNGVRMDVSVEGYTPAPDEEMRTSAILAGSKFFETLGVPLLRGREFIRADEPAAVTNAEAAHATVAIIGETMARKYFGNTDPIGKSFTVDGKEKVRLEIIGVAKDTKYSPNLRNATPVEFYVPFFGSGIRMPPTFYLRIDRDGASLVPEIRRLLKQVDPQLKIRELRSMDEVIDRLLLRERIVAQLVGFFSAFALLLTCVGLYGLLSFHVSQRTREIGIRMALGSTLRSVIGLVARQALTSVVWGGVTGVVMALLATRFVATLLYGVMPTDPITFGTVIPLLIAAAAVATWLPARRAAKVDPMVALRCE